jgi:hypothetical protein
MIKKFSSIALIAFAAIAAQATTINIRDNEAGYMLGTSASQALGVLGGGPTGLPVSQQATGTDPYTALVNFGFIASGGNYFIQHATTSLSAAQINGMAAAPVQLVAAAGAGKTIVITRAAVRITRTATAFASGGVGILQYGNAATGAGTNAVDSTLAATFFTGASGASEAARNGAVLSDTGTALQNLGIFISNQTGAFTTGTGTATVDVWYYVF